MLVKLKRRMRRVEDSLSRPFRSQIRDRTEPVKLPYLVDPMDWDGLRSLTETLDRRTDSFEVLVSAFANLSLCVEMHDDLARTQKEYAGLRKNTNDLLRAFSDQFKSTNLPAITPIIKLARGIQDETKPLLRKQEEGTITEDETRAATKLNESAKLWPTVGEEEAHLNRLPHSSEAWYSSIGTGSAHRNGCAPNTRVDILREIQAWIRYSDQKIYWLNGMSSAGKSTIAWSVCERLENSAYPTASFFCTRQQAAYCDVSCILPNISYQLSLFSRPFLSAVSDLIDQNIDARHWSIHDQFEKLIAIPLQKVAYTFRAHAAIVIDALDECEDSTGVDQLLDALLTRTSGLPVKFVVTSRPVYNIVRRMQIERNESTLTEQSLHDLSRTVVIRDIRTYLTLSLNPIISSARDLDQLTEWSGASFRRATFFVSYILHNDQQEARERIQRLHGTSPISDGEWQPDTMYTTILDMIFDSDALAKSELAEAWLVLRTVLCLPESFTADALVGLPGVGSATAVDCALEALQPLLYTSAKGIIIAMQESTGTISNELLHACRHWGKYLSISRYSKVLLDALSDFLSNRLLLWMEILNLTGYMRDGVGQLRTVNAWLTEIDGQDDMRLLVQDAQSFMIAFSWSPLSNSTPHIYVSMLPFWPDNKPLSTRYKHRILGLTKTGGSAIQMERLLAQAIIDSGSCMAHSLNNAHIAVSVGAAIHIIDAYTGRILGGPLRGHSNTINSIVYSLDGAYLVSGSDDQTFRIWGTHTGYSVGRPFRGHTASVLSVAFSPDCQFIVSGSFDMTICIWNTRTGRPIGQPLTGHTARVLSLAYSPDGASIASGSGDRTIHIWDVRSGWPKSQALVGHTASVISVAYSPTGAHIVSGSEDGTVRVWDVHTVKPIGKPLEGHTASVRSVAYSLSGEFIASGSSDGTIRVWDARTGQTISQPLCGHTDVIHSVTYANDGMHILSCSKDGTIRIWDALLSSPIADQLSGGHTNEINQVAYSSDGTRIVSGSSDKTIRIWNAYTGQPISHPLIGHTSEVKSVVCSSDNTFIVSGSSDRTIRIWDAYTGQPVGRPIQSWVSSVTCSPNSNHVVSGFLDGTIYRWDARTGECLGQSAEVQAESVYSIAYSPDGARIASGSYNRTIHIWYARTLEPVGPPFRGHERAVNSVAYSPDGACIVSGSDDETIRIWAANTGQLVGQPLKGHTSSVESVTYSPDGLYIVSGSRDKTVRIWNAHTQQEIGQLEGHTDFVCSVAYSPDGAHVVSGSRDGIIRVWTTLGENSADAITNHPSSSANLGMSRRGVAVYPTSPL
ncbi:hypothetical protein FRC07_001352 [Ceratobasidium sp. 392]|nr:hypothetical protein FRC07_001352 [Ceratobasidium sp. 392]